MNLKAKYKAQLLNSIPVVTAMEVDITDIQKDQLQLTAPLNTNINYEGTAFGGSINTLCVLSGYLLVHHLLKAENIGFDSLVIQDSQIKYLSPVQENFYATAKIKEENKKFFLNMMKRKGKGRAQIEATISTVQQPQALVQFQARFVVN